MCHLEVMNGNKPRTDFSAELTKTSLLHQSCVVLVTEKVTPQINNFALRLRMVAVGCVVRDKRIG